MPGRNNEFYGPEQMKTAQKWQVVSTFSSHHSEFPSNSSRHVCCILLRHGWVMVREMETMAQNKIRKTLD